jgi:hypothetical protein
MQFRLKLQTTHSRQKIVHHDTIEGACVRDLKKFFGRAMRGNLKACGAELEDQRLPRPLVVFDDRNPDGTVVARAFASWRYFSLRRDRIKMFVVGIGPPPPDVRHRESRRNYYHPSRSRAIELWPLGTNLVPCGTKSVGT